MRLLKKNGYICRCDCYMMKKIPTILISLLFSLSLIAQPQIKLSGFIQTMYQYGEQDALLKVGAPNENPEKSYSRIGIRRGRIRLVAEEGLASGVFMIDITEKGLNLKDAYLNIKDPWLNTLQFRVGVTLPPFGHEISLLPLRRESPERSTVNQTLFPEERDLGAMVILQAPKTSPWNILKLEAGLFAGNGVRLELYSPKNFIGRLSATKILENKTTFGIGTSYYNGKVYQGSNNVYTMKDKSFVLNSDASNKGKFAKQEFIGLEAQFSMPNTGVGLSQIRAEYLFGQQPGTAGSSRSYTNATSLPAADTYIRNFRGGYAIFIQDLGNSAFSAVLKYDWYNPNTKISGNEIGLNGTSRTDVAFRIFGSGILWKISNALRVQAYYEIVRNETTTNIAKMEKDLRDNVFTFWVQYVF